MAKILIVDDDLDHIKMVRSFLALDNHVLEFASTGEQAQNLLTVSSYDVILLDWQLPDISGVELLKWYRRNGSAPVIMLTGKGTIENREQGLDSGADDYLVKPFSARELSARIRALLRRPLCLTSSVVAGQLVLDPKRLTVTSTGKEVKLTQTEFALLEFLVRHPTEPFKSEALMTRVWKAESEATGNALRQTIKRLRAKLGEGIIVTVSGAGYKLGA